MDHGRVLQIGKIVGVFGVNGELKVFKMAEDMTFFEQGSRLMLRTDDGLLTPCTVRGAKPHKNIVRVRFEGIDDRDAAEKVVGAGLFVPRSALPDTDADTWYWCDLIGLAVYGTDEQYIGRVMSMIETGSNDVFVVQTDDAETLIPAIASVVVEIDLECGRMVVDLPDGL